MLVLLSFLKIKNKSFNFNLKINHLITTKKLKLMRTIKFTLFGLFLLAILPAFSGTTYYVRSGSGADSNDGLSINNAFQTLTKVFSGTPALVDGDIINISGTFDYYVSYKILKNITIQGTDKSTSIIRGSAGAVKNCFIVGSSSPVATPTVVIENVTFKDFDYWSDGASNNGGVINVIGASSITCRKVIFNNNQAYGAGAVNINAGTGVFEDCYFLNNRAKQRTGASNAHGGALAVSTSGTGNISITIDRCLFEGNTAENSGPAMRFVTAGTGNATLLVQNSTFTGNIVKLPSTTTTSGAVTLSIAATGTSDVKLVNNTIAYNTSEIATSIGNGIYVGGVTDKVVAINNIIYSNTRPDNSDYSITTATNIKLKESRNNITSQTFDFAANTATGASFDNVSSVSANDLGLAATLANNGGETKTLLLNGTSIAVNAGYSTGVPAVDQRNTARIGRPDIGAFETSVTTIGPKISVNVIKYEQIGDRRVFRNTSDFEKVSVYNSTGKQLLSEKMNGDTFEYIAKQGFYLLRFDGSKGSEIIKLY